MQEDDTPIETLGRYQLLRRLARGGMGELWLARTTGAAGWEKLVAIKTILPHLTDQPEFIERFIDEARIATTLTHGNIVPVFDLGHADGRYFIAMEFVDGWDLRTLLRRVTAAGDRVPDELAVYIASEVCRGLDYAHGRTDEQGRSLGIVHRDISPANVLLSRDGEVRIVDFGIASAERRLNRTLTGELRGKFAYMSPEQAAGEPLDGRSDLFSLGSVLYEMLAGQKPFTAENDMAVLKLVQHGRFRPLRELRPDLDPVLERVVERALGREPSARFNDAAAMQAALLNVLYQDTGPVSSRQLAEFCARFDRPRYSTGDIPRASFDSLLAAQLDEAATSSTSTAGKVLTPTPSPGGTPSARQRAREPDLAATNGGIEKGTGPTRTVRLRSHGERRRDRLRVAIGIAIGLIVALVAALAFQAGTRNAAQSPVVRINTNPDGALIYFNGVSYGRSTVVARVQPGTWLVRAERNGYFPVESSISFDGRNDLDLDLTLRERAPASAQATTEEAAVPAASSSAGNGLLEREAARAEDRVRGDEAHREDGSEGTISAEAGSENARATTQPLYTTLEFTGLPEGAEISVNGEALGARRTIRVIRGEIVSLAFSAPGFAVQRLEHRARGVEESLPIEMMPLARGTLTIRFIGEVMRGEVHVGGQSFGENDLSSRRELSLPVGEHRVVVSNTALGLEQTQRVEIRESENTLLNIDWRLPTGE